MVKIKLGRALKKGLESLVAPVLIGATALTGSYQEAKAHTNYPFFEIRYAFTNDVNFSNSSTLSDTNNIWKKILYVDPAVSSQTNVFAGVFMNTGGTNSPPPTSEKMRTITYSHYLTDITKSNVFKVTKGIVATNGIWQAKPFTLKTVDTTMDGNGLFDNNQFSISVANAVTGYGLVGAIQLALNQLNMVEGQGLNFLMTGPTSVAYADGSVHTWSGDPEFNQVNLDPNPGSIVFIPEPNTALLLGGGLAALASRRRYYVKKEGKGKARNYYH